MEPIPGDPIRPIETVVREHVEATMAAHPELPKYRLALELGVSPTTLYRMLKEFAAGEELVRDRR